MILNKPFMKKLLLPVVLIVLCFSVNISMAGDNVSHLIVTGGQGSLVVEAVDKSKLTITIKNSEGQLILSETISSDTGKLQLLGLANGFYEVEIKSKKSSKSFHVEVL
jgi:hypothetical protein